MPYVPGNPDEDEEERRRREEGGAIALAGEQSAGAGGGRSAQQSQGDPGYVDTNTYLNANREQAMDVANRVSGRLADQAMKLRTDTDSLGTKYEGEVEGARVKSDDDLITRAFSNPSSFIENKTDLDRFKSLRDASYAGPTTFAGREDYADVEKRVKDAVEKAKGVDTEQGRTSMLYELGGNPTRGMVSLDQLLIGADPNARKTLADAAKPFDELTGYLDSVRTGVEGKANAAKTEAEKVRAATRERTGQAVTTAQQDLDARLAAGRQQAADRAARVKEILMNPSTSLSEQEMADLDITPEDLQTIINAKDRLKNAGAYTNAQGNPDQISAWWQAGNPKMYDVDYALDPFLTTRAPDAEITRANYSRPEDYSRIAALAELSGQDLAGILDPNQANLAGTADLDVADFNAGGAKAGVTNTLKGRDYGTISYVMGRNGADVPPAEMEQWFKNHQLFLDNVYRGRLQFHSSNPDANARGKAAIEAAIRQGFYTPGA